MPTKSWVNTNTNTISFMQHKLVIALEKMDEKDILNAQRQILQVKSLLQRMHKELKEANNED